MRFKPNNLSGDKSNVNADETAVKVMSMNCISRIDEFGAMQNDQFSSLLFSLHVVLLVLVYCSCLALCEGGTVWCVCVLYSGKVIEEGRRRGESYDFRRHDHSH